jgi:hypothetical protein
MQDQRDEIRVAIDASAAQLSAGCGGSLGAAAPTTSLSVELRRVLLSCLTIQPFSNVHDSGAVMTDAANRNSTHPPRQ